MIIYNFINFLFYKINCTCDASNISWPKIKTSSENQLETGENHRSYEWCLQRFSVFQETYKGLHLKAVHFFVLAQLFDDKARLQIDTVMWLRMTLFSISKSDVGRSHLRNCYEFKSRINIKKPSKYEKNELPFS